MDKELTSIETPREGRGTQRLRQRLSIKGELLLAFLPTAIVLLMLALVEVLSEQRLLFASLASSTFLIYLDPYHGTNQIRATIGDLSIGMATLTETR
jgi:hypothetical protein